MADHSAIEWTNATWSPVLGCSPVSPGCAACYAVRTTWRLAHNPDRTVSSRRAGLVEKTSTGVLRWTGKVRCVPELLTVPLHWREPRRIFVCSQSDLFHEDVPDAFIADVFNVMCAAPRHTFQVLTKRPKRMAAFVRRWTGSTLPLANVWLGVSVEDQAAANDRIPELLATLAAVRFVSCEPLLAPVNLNCIDYRGPPLHMDGLRGFSDNGRWTQLDWAIVGGESGVGARPCDVAWIRSLVAQCRAARVPAFVKQLGAHVITRNDDGLSGCDADDWQLDDPDGQVEEDLDGTRDGYQGAPVRVHLRDRKGGDPREWPADLRLREYPR